MTSVVAYSLLSLVVLAGPVHGQEGALSADEPTRRVVAQAQAAPRVGEIRIDGRIEEDAWVAAPVIAGFVQREPNEGEPAGQDTHAWVLFDHDAIYVAARMFEADASAIRALMVPRDDLGNFFDWFQVGLDTSAEGQIGYRFQVSAAGVQLDMYNYNDIPRVVTWDAVWQSAVSIDSLGWTAEIRIPLSQIRYQESDQPQTWGLQLQRSRAAASEQSFFSLERTAVAGKVSQYGRIHGIYLPTTARRIEVRPYALSSVYNAPVADGDPFFDGRTIGVRAGSDFRLGLGSAYTVDATINPDFGQVEADPAEVNLTAFESFFDERRPFFVEDGHNFEFPLSGGQDKLFYSRRIGRAPQLRGLPGADFADVPEAAQIAIATKLTGRTPGGLSIGGMAAATRATEGRAFFEEGGRKQDFVAEPQTTFGLLAAQQDLNEGASQVRAIVTGLHRNFPAEPHLFLPDQAFTAGASFLHQWAGRNWLLDGFLAGSHVRGSPESLVAVQRASNHYFQRPDATRARMDSAATSLSGIEWRLQLDRQNREHWTGSAWIGQHTGGFEVNDLGISRNREGLNVGFRYGYRQLRPGSFLRNYDISFSNDDTFSHEALDDRGSWDSWRRAYTTGTFDLSARATLLSYHGGNLRLSWQPDLYSRTATRGGPIMVEPAKLTGSVGISTDGRQNASFNVDLGFTRGSEDTADQVSVTGTVSLRPSTRLQLELGPRVSVQRDAQQYVTASSVAPYEETFGQRYFFGELEQQTFSLRTRVNYLFSPTLSLQGYAEPFISSGDYVRYRQLARAGTHEFIEFVQGRAVEVNGTTVCSGGTICMDPMRIQHVDLDSNGAPDLTFRDRDFNVRSLFGNAVLRWEYRPGSTIYVVWQRQQEMDAVVGDFDFGRDVRRLFEAPAHNRLILKVNYWYSL